MVIEPDVPLAERLLGPVSEHEVTFAALQVKVELPPYATLVGFAVSVIAVGSSTVTVTERVSTPPPDRWHVSVYVAVNASAPVD